MAVSYSKGNFYPRSPCGERPSPDGSSGRQEEFLSTLSLRRATLEQFKQITETIFLSTLSLRRATNSFPKKDRQSNISIHALLAESDLARVNSMLTLIHFYPRSPCGERQASNRTERPRQHISIHALLAESDGIKFKLDFINQEFLSTLSLRRATQPEVKTYLDNKNFYPRSPCGERRASPKP